LCSGRSARKGVLVRIQSWALQKPSLHKSEGFLFSRFSSSGNSLFVNLLTILFMSDYKFDRNAFRMMTFKEADASNKFGKEVSYAERLRQAYFLISQAYGFSFQNPPKLDRTCFSSRKMNN
ncbi:MAG: hypothetical protein J7497_13225, partial [Chitinophagaceae bacterium]|nr:hypothetical protein [Chitinophagaceae bacterium]